MSYNLVLLTKMSECDEVITKATREKSTMELRQLNTQHRATGSSEAAPGYRRELDSLDIRIAGLEANIIAMEEGPDREEDRRKKRRQEVRRDIVIDFLTSTSVGDTVVAQYELDQLDYRIDKLDALLLEVTAHKATLTV